MSKIKDILLDIETKLIGGDAYEDIITHVQKVLLCDSDTAKDWVDEVEGHLCMEEERDYWRDQEPIPDEDSELY